MKEAQNGKTSWNPSYWVVSPNVRNNSAQVPSWRNASRLAGVAFMGYPAEKVPHDKLSQGPKFAGKQMPGIQEGDIVLIARRYRKAPDVVGFGVVMGGVTKSGGIKGIVLPDPHASVRKLFPFVPLTAVPKGVALSQCLPNSRALMKLDPQRSVDEKKLCAWMKRRLANIQNGDKGNAELEVVELDGEASPKGKRITTLQNNPQLDYQMRTKAQIRNAKRIESKLLSSYAKWLAKQGRLLNSVKLGRLQCDGYEVAERNLIEAKASTKREYIRMAVGQILDYAFQAKVYPGVQHRAILVPHHPGEAIEEWLNGIDIAIIWPKGRSFLDNAKGQFVGT